MVVGDKVATMKTFYVKLLWTSKLAKTQVALVVYKKVEQLLEPKDEML